MDVYISHSLIVGSIPKDYNNKLVITEAASVILQGQQEAIQTYLDPNKTVKELTVIQNKKGQMKIAGVQGPHYYLSKVFYFPPFIQKCKQLILLSRSNELRQREKNTEK